MTAYGGSSLNCKMYLKTEIEFLETLAMMFFNRQVSIKKFSPLILNELPTNARGGRRFHVLDSIQLLRIFNNKYCIGEV